MADPSLTKVFSFPTYHLDLNLMPLISVLAMFVTRILVSAARYISSNVLEKATENQMVTFALLE